MNDYNEAQVLESLQVGINRGKKAYHFKRASQGVLTVFAVMFMSLALMVNVSPSFADSLIDVPVIGEIVKLVRIGSGYEEVAEKGMFEKGEVIYEDESYKLSLLAYYFSDKDLNLYFTLESDNEDYHAITNFEMLDENMDFIKGGSIGFDAFNDEGLTNIEVNMIDHTLPDTLTIKFDLTRDDKRGRFGDDYIYLEDLSLKLKKKVKDVSNMIDISETVHHENMNFDFISLEITPTTMNLQMDVSSDDMVFYDFKKIYIKSGENVYERISDGLVRSGNMESGMTYFFKSPYFDSYKDFEIVIEDVYALPIDLSYVEIDLENNEMIKGSDDKLEFIGVSKSADIYTVKFKSSGDERVGFSQYDDHHFSSIGTMYLDEGREYHLEVEKENLDDEKILIDFNHYPNTVEMKKSIRIE
ncbi:DUF4179 domain-containing protein [Acidaminobacter sp. JC074]|uniref:DUF4179 domain-containing protein n=1 Tax=Acidaminobacter sp. JC074 TaxID=2530199 RepID=UPI001F110F10|nr:DUF4179 domain-containing protein [Acidaminobacter sp. JC074]MCH4887080.1 DUF4179 domain-containing protein [Acidaminobacter sp. JC074]